MEASTRRSSAGPERRDALRRLLLLGGLTLALVAKIAGPAAADSGVLVHFVGDRPDQRFFSAEEVKGLWDVFQEPYVFRGSPGDNTTLPFTGASVASLITGAGRSPGGVGYVRFLRIDGSWTTLKAPDLTVPENQFVDGRRPLVFVDSTGTRYIRPARNAQDINAADDTISPGSSQPLEMWVSTGALLDVIVLASTTSPDAGKPVSFSVRLSPEAPSATVSWSFRDGQSVDGRDVSHSYAGQGTYDVVATATAPDGSGGASDPIQIKVQDPPSKPGSDPGTGTKDEGLPLGATKGQGNGNGNGSSNGNGSGNGEGTSKDTSASPGSSGGKTSSSSRDKAAKSPASTTPAAPSTATPSATPPSAVPPPATAAPPPPTPPASSSGATRRKPTRRRRASPGRATPPLVRGVLVDAPIAPAAVAAPSVSEAARQAAARAGRLPHPLPVGVAAVAGLMGLGAWREVVRRRRRLVLLG